MKTLYVTDRKVWRSWLRKHHDKEDEIWLIYYRKSSGKQRISYNHAVEEALCFGWVDSILRPIDKERYAQRFSARRKGSKVSEMNKERIRRLMKQKKMAKAGLAAVSHVLDSITSKRFILPKDIEKSLKKDKETWKNFQASSTSYKRIRIGWIEMARGRPDVFRKRLSYFLKMTKQNKQFGMLK
jgi:uncharacterized protein YdeI (YjbR/CyaY-like superfamily)